MTTTVRRYRSYILTVLLFLAAMSVKVFLVDRPLWDQDLWRYAISNIIVIPIVWYAGYFFRDAIDDTPQ